MHLGFTFRQFYIMINNPLKCSLHRKIPLASRRFAKRKKKCCLCGACAGHGAPYCDFCFDRFAFGRDPDYCDGHDHDRLVDDAGCHPYPRDDGGSRGHDHDDCHDGSRRDHAGLCPTVTDELDSFVGHPREPLLVEEVVLGAVPCRRAACHNYHSDRPYHHDDLTSLPCRRLSHAFDRCHDDIGLSRPLVIGYDYFPSHAAGDSQVGQPLRYYG